MKALGITKAECHMHRLLTKLVTFAFTTIATISASGGCVSDLGRGRPEQRRGALRFVLLNTTAITSQPSRVAGTVFAPGCRLQIATRVPQRPGIHRFSWQPSTALAIHTDQRYAIPTRSPWYCIYIVVIRK